MESCDVLIVGGGPSGSTAARALTRAGLDVLLIDKAAFPRDKPCAGWITPPVVRLLDLDLDAYRATGRTCQPITGFRTSRLGFTEQWTGGLTPASGAPPASAAASSPDGTRGRTLDTDFPGIVSYGIRRREFDHYLLERCGARVRTGVAVERLRRDGDRWIVNEAFAAPLVIGAGGHFCPVARRLGATDDARVTQPEAAMSSAVSEAGPREEEAIVAAQEIEVRLTPAQAAACLVAADRPELYLCEDFKGYGWCFRKGDVLNVGLGRLDRHRLSAHVRAFADWLIAMGRVPADLAWRWKGHAYLLREASARRPSADGVLLIGDAAGLAYGRSGEGIKPAVESALLAARTVLAARASGGYPSGALAAYAAALEARFGASAARARQGSLPPAASPHASSVASPVAGAAVPTFSERAGIAVAGALLSSRWFTRDVILRRWFLRVPDPPLGLDVNFAARL